MTDLIRILLSEVDGRGDHQDCYSIIPRASLLRRLLMAGRYVGERSTLKSLSNGLHWTKAFRPLAFRQRALKMLGREPRTSLVAGTWWEESKSK